MTILVTGAIGTVGQHVVKQLAAKGVRVKALSRNPVAANFPAGVEGVAGDLNNPETLGLALDGVNGMFLITSSDAAGAWLQTSPEVIALAERSGVKRVVVLVGYEEGPVEEALQASSMEWTLLKPGEFMANILVDWADSIRGEHTVREVFGDAPSARIHEADIAAVAVTSLLEDGHHRQSYVLTGPETLTRREAVRIIGEGIGRELRFVELTEEEARQNWKTQGYSDEDIEFFILMGQNPPAIGHTVLPTVKQVTGRPARTLAEWVAEHKAMLIS